MALKSVLDTLEGVDDAVKTLYVEDGERFVLAIDGIDDHPEVANLKSAYERTKADKAKAASERDALKVKVDALPEDFDAEIWEKAKSGKTDDAILAAKLAEQLTPVEQERDEYKSKLELLEQQIRDEKLSKAVISALADNKVPEEVRRGAAAHALEGVKIEFNGTDVIVETDMGPQTLADYTKRWVAGPGAGYVPSAKGGDAPGAGKGAATTKKWGDMTSAEKVALHRENPEEYQRVKEAG